MPGVTDALDADEVPGLDRRQLSVVLVVKASEDLIRQLWGDLADEGGRDVPADHVAKISVVDVLEVSDEVIVEIVESACEASVDQTLV
ncbi:hypothetical protein GCM10027599_00880 [Yimella radicis]